MTELIDAVQKQDPGSALIELFELELPEGTQYFHSGINGDTEIQFREKAPPYNAKTYIAIPIELTGIEKNTDGASARPSLTVANVLSTFSDAVDMTNKELIGKRVLRRTTLRRYLVDGDDDTGTLAPPIEFPTEKFIIDRIAGENKVQINFELAAASDLEGVKLPNRLVVGKYCGWEYQGAVEFGRGGCLWKTNSKVFVTNDANQRLEYKAYFNIADEPIVLLGTSGVAGSGIAAVISTAYNASTAYGIDNWVLTGAGTTADPYKYWRSDSADHTGNTPSDTSLFWKRIRTYTVWNGTENNLGTAADYIYDRNELIYVEHSNTVWRIIKNTPVEQEPSADSSYWVRGDLCGKILESCKCRFQWNPDGSINTTMSAPTLFPATKKKTNVILPFGGFPGSEKYR